MAEVKHLAERKAPRCPICGKPPEVAYKPFCSQRCTDVDLHRWLAGGYVIPTDETPESDDPDNRKEEDNG
jgi:endogenous inhibitor of DNA gyrase (YacG/DUF329 family)